MRISDLSPSQLKQHMTKEQHAALVADAASKQLAVTYDAYYSEVIFAPTIAANTATMGAVKRKPFAYKQGDDLTSVNIGYTGAAGTAADARHTNLLQPSQTKDGQRLLVRGVAIAPRSDSDADLLIKLAPHLVCRAVFGGSTIFDLGPLELVPGACGFHGTGSSVMREPELNVGVAKGIGSMSSGWPIGTNFKKFPRPFEWSSAGNSDSTFAMEIELPVAQAFALPVARVAAAGVNAYAQPTTGQLFIKLLCWLDAVQLAKRSVNR
jgi:hypothetical protein